MIVWILSDGKPGHLNQVLGLLAALEKTCQIELHEIPVVEVKAGFFSWLLGKVKVPLNIGSADLIIGAGHRTHWPLLALGRKTKAKTLVLMRPSLPLFLFDFICAPIHDRLPLRSNCLSTEGAINRMQPGEKQMATGLILIGGPSAHARWQTDVVIEQLNKLQQISDNVSWTLTTSRRTPADFIEKVKPNKNLKIVPWNKCDKNWLPEKMTHTEQIWVTPDSVSMIYEALTANAKVGVFQLKTIPTRVGMGIEKLISGNVIADFNQWKKDQQWTVKDSQLNEAERCASWLLKRLDLSQ